MTSMTVASGRKTPSAPKRVPTSPSEGSRSIAERTHPPGATATWPARVNDTVHTTAAVRISSSENSVFARKARRDRHGMHVCG